MRRRRWKRRQRVGKYRLVRKIGSGGFAVVFRARDTVQKIDVALKLPTSSDPDDLDDLRYEVEVASKLSHPNLLPVLNADYVDGRLVVAYPLGQGCLHDRMKKPFTTREVFDITVQLLSGLHHAHENKVVHCDVKPGNVIIFEVGVKLCDFGLCKRAADTFKTSQPGGTLGYMAPELAMGHPSPRSDLFSVGLIAWEMLTGKLPTWPYDWPPPGHEKVVEGCRPLVEALRVALDPDARSRYSSAEVFLWEMTNKVLPSTLPCGKVMVR
jgi:serine/threonine-protein kinase